MDLSSIPPGLTPEAQKKREEFQAAYLARLEEVEKVALSILVWGPDPKKESAVAEKRKEICEELISQGYNAMFSEDLVHLGPEVSEKTKEFVQALEVDLIIILLEDSPGALAEAHDFCNVPAIVHKIYLMIPHRYEAGYPARGAIKLLEDGYGGVYWYENYELDSSNVVKQALIRARARRELKYITREGYE